MKSRVETPISFPVVTIWRNGSPPSLDERFITEKPKPPLCDTMLTVAGLVIGVEHRAETGEHAVRDVDHALAVGADHADAVLARDVRRVACCSLTPSPPISEKPEVKMITYGTPFAPHCAQHVGDARGVHQDQHEVRDLRHVRERGIALHARDLRDSAGLPGRAFPCSRGS